MAAVTTNTPAVRKGFFANLVETIAAHRASRRVYRNTYNELMALSDRDLADIGISRSMIPSIAMEAALDNRV